MAAPRFLDLANIRRRRPRGRRARLDRARIDRQGRLRGPLDNLHIRGEFSFLPNRRPVAELAYTGRKLAYFKIYLC